MKTLLLSLTLLAAACGGNLHYDVFHGDEKGFLATSTLVSGDHDAVLVDAQFNLENGRKLASFIAEKGKTLRAIYITHAHPDHFFGVEAVLEKFPGTPVYATPAVIAHMKQLNPGKLAYWGPIYGDDLTKSPVEPQPLPEGGLNVEGANLEFRDVSADTEPMTVVKVPELGLLIAGDLAYANVHVWLAETPKQEQRARWLASLQEQAATQPAHVVAGHATADAGDRPSILTETANYIRTFDELAAKNTSDKALEQAMLAAYPKAALPIILQLATQSVYAAPTAN